MLPFVNSPVKIPGVPIQLYSIDVPVSILEDYKLAVWEYTKDRKVWGLTHLGYATHMSYGLDYANPKEIIERRREKYKKDPHQLNGDWLRWYFDVGARLYSTLDSLETACKELGIWDETT